MESQPYILKTTGKDSCYVIEKGLSLSLVKARIKALKRESVEKDSASSRVGEASTTSFPLVFIALESVERERLL